MMFFHLDEKKDKYAVGPTEFLSEKKRIVYISERILLPFGETCDMAPYYLLALDELDSGTPIRLVVDSAGGFLQSFLFIYDVITEAVRAPVYTLAMGRCTSAAVLPFIAGKKGKRFCLPHTEFILHYPEGIQTRKISSPSLEPPPDLSEEPEPEKKDNESVLHIPEKDFLRMHIDEEFKQRVTVGRKLLQLILRVHLKPDKVDDVLHRLEKTGRLMILPEEAVDVGIADKILTEKNRDEFFS